MKIIASWLLDSRGIWGLLMVLVVYGMEVGEGMRERCVDSLPFWQQVFSSEANTCNTPISWGYSQRLRVFLSPYLRIAQNYMETVPFHKISTPGN